ncbi:beta-N-acetylhexosaminidase (plasmid) [Pedobacter sp. BS3]|uniref:beta-N-acetylhexosaminidase n=1 Tax=Pedobacter sp. BS3 TaxID=2567937 RepID=UPI0011ED358C|nr:beta-N-acetylhexosaminidase [Pedobacter sp. BS3]TZF85938.1 beta-N-acetylhexosaminidase [Pedobacter sp. BS3]
MRKITFLFFLLCSTSLFAQKISIIPEPVEANLKAGQNDFIINAQTKLVLAGNEAVNSAAFFLQYLEEYYHLKIDITRNSADLRNTIVFKKDTADTVKGGYTFDSDEHTIHITGNDDAGIFYGMQTLIQLLPTDSAAALTIPAAHIRDYPRFAYRGLHLDVSRHMFPVSFIKKYIDYIALHKMNYFHWHLTDDSGWRIEIKKYPQLTQIGAWRKGTLIGQYPGKGNDGIRYGGYYTQNEIREVIQYAAKRYITIIPEIDMPGHCMAVLATFPELSTTPDEPKEVATTWGIFNKFNNVLVPSEKTFRFLEDVLSEVMDLFPSEYVHIGGDECAKKWWQQSKATQDFIRKHHLKDEEGLQSYFVNRVEKFVNAHGKKIIGWDEILQGGLAPNATVMSWQGIKGGIAAAKQHHQVIMSPSKYCYFDHPQSLHEDSLTVTTAKYLPLDSVYAYEPVPAQLSAEEGRYIWGAQANVWTEYMANPSKVEYMIFPRLSAFSEVVWSPKEKRNRAALQDKLLVQFRRYNLWKSSYSTEILKKY